MRNWLTATLATVGILGCCLAIAKLEVAAVCAGQGDTIAWAWFMAFNGGLAALAYQLLNQKNR